MDKREKAERAKQEDAILNRVLMWIVGSVLLEALLLLLNRFYVNSTVAEIELKATLYHAFGILVILFPVCFVGALVWWISSYKKGKQSVLPRVVSTILAILSICTAVMRFYPQTGVQYLYVGVPCMAVLALVYYLYQREFFVVMLMNAAGMLGLWLLNRRIGHGSVVYTYLVIEGIFLAGVAIVAHMLQRNDGVLVIGGKNVSLLPKSANYTMLYVTCLVVALLQVVGLVLGSMMILYGILVVWMLAMAVYYTVRLM